jgi:hypothetical protein
MVSFPVTKIGADFNLDWTNFIVRSIRVLRKEAAIQYINRPYYNRVFIQYNIPMNDK